MARDLRLLRLAELDPLVGEAFTHALDRLVEAFQTPDEHQRKRGALQGVVRIELRIEHDPERETTDLEASVTSRGPARRSVACPLRLRGSELYVDPNDEQLHLLKAGADV